VTNYHFRVCIKDDAGYDGQRDIVHVDYLAIGGSYEENICLVTTVFTGTRPSKSKRSLQ